VIYLLIVLNIFNIFDAVSTHMALSMGVAKELNPIMAWAYGVSPWVFIVGKLALVGGCSLVLGFLPKKTSRLPLYLLIGLVQAYFAIVVWHLAMWSMILQ